MTKPLVFALAILVLARPAGAQTVTVDDDVTSEAAKREPPVWRRDVRPYAGPLPVRRAPPTNATVPTVAGTLLGAFLGGAGGATLGQHQIDATRAGNSDAGHGPDFTAIGYGAAGVVVGAVVGGVVGYLLGQLSF